MGVFDDIAPLIEANTPFRIFFKDCIDDYMAKGLTHDECLDACMVIVSDMVARGMDIGPFDEDDIKALVNITYHPERSPV